MKHRNVKSSVVQSIGYDEKTKQMEVKFANGKTYRYSEIAPELHKECCGAPSIGSWIHHNLRGIYDHEIV